MNAFARRPEWRGFREREREKFPQRRKRNEYRADHERFRVERTPMFSLALIMKINEEGEMKGKILN